ncbi:uncharacterized protein LACBIDRAFT_304636 [Laccaria bicolor S238N-H82]|uniref:Predicted protein n=1 Tax=Laccaria bicolor (strain S238N-H82 / ATCC MYA-4686) TaxID=486041 RepID=B0DM19_LACBS|nr:uncharacterized protein LACBIDRAFT_304636 [Laccaria bicolor S238N-H82]EDR04489.1 predicted protein [Laccaria bicolor S238N-H82]|eukprot:XP_001885008.1 predicted protein [Laccaria bicolor S238N-H82]
MPFDHAHHFPARICLQHSTHSLSWSKFISDRISAAFFTTHGLTTRVIYQHSLISSFKPIR